MLVASSLQFLVKVEGQSHSNHRNPQGVYHIEVVEEKTIAHSAYAAIQVAKDAVPFLNENPESMTLKAYTLDGEEISIPRPLCTHHEHHGFYVGRAKDFPDTITFQ